MSRNHIRLETEQQKQIYERFRYLAERYGRWEVWADFITMSACSLCLSDRQRREEGYVNIVKRYKLEEIQRFEEMFALTIEALEVNPNQDFFGDLFMRFDLGSTWKGQFFTPYHICELMSKLTAGDLQAQLEQQPWISVCDPAVGAGALMIAFVLFQDGFFVRASRILLFAGLWQVQSMAASALLSAHSCRTLSPALREDCGFYTILQ